ncbi:hypothetical protein [Vibrio sp. B1Z05]|uniref:hypothetical protein n=1 Tax=Vibrio sp. B1Z05 TaxID=2654980 RepID=UPI00128CA7C3|nr:hypothetical protein [Vibrio sp. B1Z05]MPW37990.1 hypothetical protein [Vibrio sp. B1Z05]
MKKLFILVVLLFSICSLVAFASLFGLLTYKDKGYDWQWLGFPLINSGVQIARTSDTHQLLLRKVYLFPSTEVSVYTTMNNKLVLHLARFQTCSDSKQGQLQLNQKPVQTVTFNCKGSNEMIFSVVTSHLNSAIIDFDGQKLSIDFAEWNIADIKKDQFKQLHSQYFEQLGQPSEYQWSRD